MLLGEFNITGTGRYECKVCLKTFSRIGGLKQHLSSHGDLKSSLVLDHSNRSKIQEIKQEVIVVEENYETAGTVLSEPLPNDDVQNMFSSTTVGSFVEAFSAIGSGQCDINSNGTSIKQPVMEVTSHQQVSSKNEWNSTCIPLTGNELLAFSGRYECPLCLQTFSRGEGLKKHMLCHRSETESCQITSLSKKIKPDCDLTQAEADCHQGCLPQTVNNYSKMPQALNIVLSNGSPTLSGRFTCKLCPKTFSRKGGLTQHMFSHGNVKPFCCEICGKKFLRKYSLDIHIRAHVKEKPHECEICDKTFVTKGQLSTHMRTHTQEKPYHCDICQKTFSQKDHMKHHRLSHTNEQKRFQCPICPATFTRKYTVQLHVQGCHSSQWNFGCSLCGKLFKRKHYLSAHMKSHLQEKSFPCDYCPKRFSQKGSLMIHMRRHNQEKPFKCSICGMAFADSGDLRRHSRTHNNVKPYSCEFCSKSFAQIGNLKRHGLIHTDEKPYQCPVCEKTFRQKAHQVKHMRAHAGLAKMKFIKHAPCVTNFINDGTKNILDSLEEDSRNIDFGNHSQETDVQLDTTVPLDNEWKVKVECLTKSYQQDGTQMPYFSPDVQWSQTESFIKQENTLLGVTV